MYVYGDAYLLFLKNVIISIHLHSRSSPHAVLVAMCASRFTLGVVKKIAY